MATALINPNLNFSIQNEGNFSVITAQKYVDVLGISVYGANPNTFTRLTSSQKTNQVQILPDLSGTIVVDPGSSGTLNLTAPNINIANLAYTVNSTVNIQCGVSTAGVQSVNICGGLSAKTLTLGNTSANTSVNLVAGSTGLVNTTKIATPGDTGGYTYSGTLTATTATQTAVLNSKVGVVTFTAQTIAAGAQSTLTITNTSAGSLGQVSLYTGTIAASSTPVIVSATWTANTNIVIVINNVGTASTGAVTLTIAFTSFN